MRLKIEKIKEELKRRQWSAYYYAGLMKMPTPALYKILKDGDGNYTIGTVQRLADGLGLDPKELLE